MSDPIDKIVVVPLNIQLDRVLQPFENDEPLVPAVKPIYPQKGKIIDIYA